MGGRLFDTAGYGVRLSAIPLLATSVAALSLGAWVVWQQRGRRVGLLFLLMPLTIAAWLVCFSLMLCSVDEALAGVWARAAYLAIPLIPAAVYGFTLAATQPRPGRAWRAAALWLLSALWVVLFVRTDLLMDGLHHYAWGDYPRFRWPSLLFVGGFLGGLLLSLREQQVDARRAGDERHRARSRAYLLAFSVGSLGCVDYLPALGVPVYPLGFLPVLGFIALTARAIQRYHLVDITPSLAAPQVLATMADPLLVCDAEDRIRLVNPAASALLGYRESELAGLPVESLLDGSPEVAAFVRDALHSRRTWIEETRLRSKAAGSVDVSLSVAPLEDGGVRVGSVLIARDVRDLKSAEAALRASEARYRALAETEAAAIFILEGERIRYANPALEAMSAYSSGDLGELRFWELAHPDSRASFRDQGLAQQTPGSAPVRFELKMLTKRGDARWFDLTLTPIDIEGRASAVVTAFDVTERKTAEDALRESERRLREILDNVQLASLFLDLEGRVTYCNEYLRDLLGCSAEEVIGRGFEAFLPEKKREAVRREFLENIAAGFIAPHAQGSVMTKGGERRLISWNNTVLRDIEGKVVGTASIGADITERKRAEERLHHGAYYDALTGLPNRNLFVERLAACIARARRRPQYHFAALFLDIDRFKVVNDSLGHVTGDQLLVEIAQRLGGCLRPGDSVARLGGDEFAVLIDDMGEQDVPSRVAERIQAALRAPFELAGREVFVTASVGIALNRSRYEEPEDFLRDADTAMHHAKARGRGHHQVFDTAMHAQALGLLHIENDLHRAVERQELSVHYQPIVSLKTGALVGFEALARWWRQGLGLVPTEQFIRIAEETGLIVPMGSWVLREACSQMRTWREQLGADHALTVSVNLSAKQFAQPDLVAKVAGIVEEAALDPGCLRLEITESVLMQDPEAAAAMLAELATRRVKICIDDFGTGYSSLSYLLRFPANTLKIDRSFVSDLGRDGQHAEMVRTIVVLARNLGMDVIGEGVETEEQKTRLQALGCDYAQGYLFSKPLDADAVQALLRRTRLPQSG